MPATARKRQKPQTFDLFSLRCQECGECLVRTTSDYYACPKGHGRLHETDSVIPPAGDDTQANGSWFS